MSRPAAGVDARAKLRPPLVMSYLTTGVRMVRRGLRGPRRFPGDAAAICRSVVDACWTGDYLAASGGHFRQFWTRDLAFSAEAVAALGHVQRARLAASLAWALRVWSRRGAPTTTIFPGRRPLDVHSFGVDSLPLLLHALRVLGADGDALVRRHARWLRGAVAGYVEQVVDRATGLVRPDRVYATHRDVVVTRSNATANAMVALLSAVLEETAWFPDPVPAGAAERLVDRFWRGDVFVDHPDTGVVSADATVFPFWFRLVPDSLGLAGALERLRLEGLAHPMPLRYVARPELDREDPQATWLLPDYQGSAVWTSLGAMYLALLARADPTVAAEVLARYAERIEADGTLWEVFAATPDGRLRPYVGRFGLFRSDEAMLWASLFVAPLERARTAG